MSGKSSSILRYPPCANPLERHTCGQILRSARCLDLSLGLMSAMPASQELGKSPLRSSKAWVNNLGRTLESAKPRKCRTSRAFLDTFMLQLSVFEGTRFALKGDQKENLHIEVLVFKHIPSGACLAHTPAHPRKPPSPSSGTCK